MEYLYESIFAHATFQFCGHIDEYLIRKTRNLTILRTITRSGIGDHALERYECGQCVERRMLKSSQNIFLYYLLVFIHHNRELWRCAKRDSGVTTMLFMHPIECFGMWVHRFFHRVKYVFWVWDWFPPVNIFLKIYAAILRFYIRRVDATCALTTAIARKLGDNIPVAMLGMERQPCADQRPSSRRILVVGQLRHGQGIEEVLDFLGDHQEYTLSLIGAAANGFEREITSRIHKLGIDDHIYFPNKFVSQDELSKHATQCFCGIAIYSTENDNFTHFADPGKVKSYIEMGLPVVMTRISEIVPYIEKFHAGEIIDSTRELSNALERINANPQLYAEGVQSFASFFDADTYYDSKLGRLL